MMRLEVTIDKVTSVYHVGDREESRYARHLWRTCKPETLVTVKDEDGTILEILRLDELFTNPFIK
jgi:hypothetical protein